MSTPRSSITGRRGAYLVELDLGGRVCRHITGPEAAEIDDADGRTHLYAIGIDDISVEQAAGDTPPGVSVSIHAPPDGDEWAVLVERGHSLALAQAVVRRWYEGQLLDEAEVVVRGLVVDAVYGDRWEPFTFSVEPQLRRRGDIPDPAARVSEDTWPVAAGLELPEPSIGVYVPLIIGYPGDAPDTLTGTWPTTPGVLMEWSRGVLLMDSSKLGICAGEIDAAQIVLANYSSVAELDGLTSKNIIDRTVKTTRDAQNRLVSYVDFDGAYVGRKQFYPLPDTEYRIGWRNAAGYGGGLLKRDRSGPMRGAGEVLRWFLEEWTDIQLDTGRMEAQRALLDAYLLDFAITERCSVWDFIRAHLLPILPIEWQETSRGGYFQAFRLQATAAEAVAHLRVSTPEDPSGQVVRTSPVTTASDVRNRIVLHYRVGGPQSRAQRTVVVDATTADGALASWHCARSQALYGVRELELTTHVVSDAATATRIGFDTAYRLALPRRSLRVQGGLDLDARSTNDVITLTDPGLGWEGKVAIVRGKVVTDQDVSLGLVLTDDPLKRGVA